MRLCLSRPSWPEPSRFAGLVIVNGHAWGFDRPEATRFVDGLCNHFEVTIDHFVKVVFPEPDSNHPRCCPVPNGWPTISTPRRGLLSRS